MHSWQTAMHGQRPRQACRRVGVRCRSARRRCNDVRRRGPARDGRINIGPVGSNGDEARQKSRHPPGKSVSEFQQHIEELHRSLLSAGDSVALRGHRFEARRRTEDRRPVLGQSAPCVGLHGEACAVSASRAETRGGPRGPSARRRARDRASVRAHHVPLPRRANAAEAEVPRRSGERARRDRHEAEPDPRHPYRRRLGTRCARSDAVLLQ